MGLLKTSLFGFILLTSFGAFAKSYGQNKLVEAKELPSDYSSLVKASATLIHKDLLIADEMGGEISFVNYNQFREEHNLCSEEQFGEQMVPGSCSGCLIGPQLLLTAAHCVGESNKSQFKVVFGFSQRAVMKKDIYNIIEIVKRDRPLDYAIVRLDRPVGTTPVKYQQSKTPEMNTELLLIGSYAGLPLKGSFGSVKYTGTGLVSTDLDAFEGDSGSCVYNKKTKEVEGILISGDKKIVADESRGCNHVSHLPSSKFDERNGERVRTTNTFIDDLEEALSKP